MLAVSTSPHELAYGYPRVLFSAASHQRITPPACAGGLCQLNDKFLLSEQLNQTTSRRTGTNEVLCGSVNVDFDLDQFVSPTNSGDQS